MIEHPRFVEWETVTTDSLVNFPSERIPELLAACRQARLVDQAIVNGQPKMIAKMLTNKDALQHTATIQLEKGILALIIQLTPSADRSAIKDILN